MRGGKRKGGAMYAVASGLKGFRSSSLRIRVERDLGDVVIVRTADLLDAGTPLALDRSQVRPETAENITMHREGLVAFAN